MIPSFTEKKEPRIHLVISGNYSEFKQFCKDRIQDFEDGLEEFSGDIFVYYSYREAISGYRFYNVYNYGTHFYRKDIEYDYITPCIQNKWFTNEMIWENKRYLKVEHI